MAKAELVIVDEIHNLNLATSAGEDMSDHLKYFTEHIQATFVYAGINVENSGLFSGMRGRQISGRSVLMTIGTVPLTEESDPLVATRGDCLRLHDHEPGALMAQSLYLHHRTGGIISSPSHLIHMAAILVILNGTERIDRALLVDIILDHTAQPIAPRQDVTTRSFTPRINNANRLTPGQLIRAMRRDRRPWMYDLATWNGTPPEVLELAIPQLANRHPDPQMRPKLIGRPIRITHSPACHRCTLSRGAGP